MGIPGLSSLPQINLLSKAQEVKETMTTTKRLKYLGIEMLRTNATKSSSPEVGLFRGLRTRTDGEGATAKILRLIVLGIKDKENDIRALNLDVFNVLSLRMSYGDTKELIVFKANDSDQKKAMELLELALGEFQTEKRMIANDPEIVDIGTFEDVPPEFFSPEEKKGNLAANYNNMYSQCGHQNDSWKEQEEKRKEKKALEDKMRQTPTLIKREDAEKLPGLKVLNAMKKKVNAIASGEYDGKLVDPDPEDTFEDEKKTSSVK